MTAVTALSALAILMPGWFALRPTSQNVQAFNAQAFNAQGLATVQAFSATVQAFNAQGLANTCRSSTRSAVERRALPWSAAPRSAAMLWSAALCHGAPQGLATVQAFSATVRALAILMLGWFALRPTSQTVQAFNAQAFNAQGLATVQAFSVTGQAFNAQGLANTCGPSTRSARSFW